LLSLGHIDVRFASSLKQQLHIASLGHIDVRFASSLKQQLHIASLGHKLSEHQCDRVKRYVIIVLVS
jgi:hypothetical protein